MTPERGQKDQTSWNVRFLGWNVLFVAADELKLGILRTQVTSVAQTLRPVLPFIGPSL